MRDKAPATRTLTTTARAELPRVPSRDLPEQSGSGGSHPPAWLPAVVTAGLVITALNLRPTMTSLGALLAEVRSGLGMSATVAGLLTSVAALCFTVFGVAAPRLSRRFGPAAVIGAGMLAITVGLALRSMVGGSAAFLALSALALAGIALSNILLPVVVERWFPGRVGVMTGLYTMALALGSGGAAAAAVPLASALGGSWRLGLGLWAVLAALAVLPWLVVTLKSGRPVGAGARSAAAAAPHGKITRSPTAWALAVFFGLQTAAAYIGMAWMPQIFRDAGMSPSTAGGLLAVTMAVGVPLSFAVPALAGRLRNQGPLVVALGLFGITGYLGLAIAPAAAPWGWAVMIGVSNCAFPLALTLIPMRSRTSAGVVRLSAFTQCIGYLIAVPGPTVVGALYQHTGGWDLPIALILGLFVPQVAAGVLAGRARHVEDQIHSADPREPAPTPS